MTPEQWFGAIALAALIYFGFQQIFHAVHGHGEKPKK